MKETFTEFPLRNILRTLLPTAALLAAACTKDPTAEFAPQGRALRFDVAQNDGWNTPQSRAATGDEPSATTQVIKLQGETPADTLFLHVTIADGIEPQAVSGNDEPKTRADLIEDISQLDEFAVDGYSYAPGTWSSSLSPNLMEVQCIEEGNGIWKPSDRDYYWPGAKKKVRFFAFAPSALQYFMTENSQSFTYNGTNRFLNEDWLFADTGELDGDMNAPVSLSFKHILSCVKFVTGDDMIAGKITNISFVKHYRDAVFLFENAAWSSLKQCANQRLVANWETDGTPDTELGSVFLMPQVFPEDAMLQIAFVDELTSTSRTLSASLAGLELPMGKTVTFRLSTSSLNVVPYLKVGWMNDFTYQGGTYQYNVASYVEVSSGGAPSRVATPWTAEFSTDDGQTWTTQKPEWLTEFTSEGAGGYAPANYTATAAIQQRVTSNRHNDILQAATPVVGTYDLSTNGGTTPMNTANCYIINAPGRYSLPLVYGNAIKNGVTNSSAYISSAPAGSGILSHFVNHLNAAITDPYIYNNAGCVPADAVLVWQDESGLVTDVVLDADGRNLNFMVPASTIRQGNAVVAVRDASGTIMWSWHVWVTDYVPNLPPTIEDRYDPTQMQRDKIVTNDEGVRYTFMPINIGWCYRDITSYEARSVKVRFRQPETGTTTEKEVVQKAFVHHPGSNLYFAFGRKDPMPGFIYEPGEQHVLKDWYSDEYTFIYRISNLTIGESIQNPFLFLRSSNQNIDWVRAAYHNRWNTDNRSNEVVKTIYDPSPVGYHLPALNAFTGFKYLLNNTGEGLYGAGFNSPYTSASDCADNLGFEFYCNKMSGVGSYDTAGGVIFFPFSGNYNSILGIPHSGGTGGYYWTAIPGVTNDGVYHSATGSSMHIAGSLILPNTNDRRRDGLAVRPVRE